MKGFLKAVFLILMVSIFLFSIFLLHTLNPDMPLETVIFRTKLSLILMGTSGGALIAYIVLR